MQDATPLECQPTSVTSHRKPVRWPAILPALLVAVLAHSAALAQERAEGARVTITGRVVDELSRSALEGVTVRIADLGLVLRTDSAGEFEIRDVAPGTYQLTLRRSGYEPASGDFMIARSGSFVTALMPVAAEGSATTGRLTGRVVDGESGVPLAGAEVRLPRLSRATVTDEEGRFIVGDVPPGRHRVEFSFLGYATLSDTLTVGAGRTSEVRVPLPVDPVDLPLMEVTVERREIVLENVGFYDRLEEGWGRFIDLEAIDRRSPSEMTDLLTTVNGVVLRTEPLNPNARYIVLRGGMNSSFSRAPNSPAPPCYPVVVLDGLIVHRDADSPAMIDNLIDPAAVAGIEIYPRQTGIPVQYAGSTAACGAILIWTRG